jgi:hypothetical protein
MILILFLCTLAIGLLAQWHVKRTYARHSHTPTAGGYTSAEAAHEILRQAGITNVDIVEHVQLLGGLDLCGRVRVLADLFPLAVTAAPHREGSPMKKPLHHLAWGFVPVDGFFPNPSLPADPTPFRFAHEGEGRHWSARQYTPSPGQAADAAPLPSPSMQFL